jgi:CheY-like chemotaxis protein
MSGRFGRGGTQEARCKVNTEVDGVVLRVLIAADHGEIADEVAAFAAESGHRVRVARDGDAAMQLLAEEPADLLLLQLALPNANSFEVARRVRARFGDAIRIVALAPFVDRARQELVQAAGCDDLVLMPPGAIAQAIHSRQLGTTTLESVMRSS